MKLTTSKSTQLTIDIQVAKQLFQNLRHYFEDEVVPDGETDDETPFCIALGILEGKNPSDLAIYLDPRGKAESDAEDDELLEDAVFTD